MLKPPSYIMTRFALVASFAVAAATADWTRKRNCGPEFSWHQKDTPSKDCAWVGRAPEERCDVRGDAAEGSYVTAREACPTECDPACFVFTRGHVNKRHLIVHGAMARHNFGDILMAHVVSKIIEPLHRQISYTDIFENDMRGVGGFYVHAITDFFKTSATWNDTVMDVVVAGGEVTGCSVGSAVSMFPLSTFREPFASKAVKTRQSIRFNRRSLAYVLERQDFAHPGVFFANTIGGGARHDILQTYDFVAFRNKVQYFQTHPDSVITIKHFFHDRIQQHHNATIHKNYIAFQIRAQTLSSTPPYLIASQLETLSGQTGMPIVMFRAGAAPRHDSIKTYEAIKKHMSARVDIMINLNVWSICAVIANADLLVSTSLHTRIVAFAYQVPRITLNAGSKQRSFMATVENHISSANAGNFVPAATNALRAQTRNFTAAQLAVGDYMTHVASPMLNILLA